MCGPAGCAAHTRGKANGDFGSAYVWLAYIGPASVSNVIGLLMGVLPWVAGVTLAGAVLVEWVDNDLTWTSLATVLAVALGVILLLLLLFRKRLGRYQKNLSDRLERLAGEDMVLYNPGIIKPILRLLGVSIAGVLAAASGVWGGYLMAYQSEGWGVFFAAAGGVGVGLLLWKAKVSIRYLRDHVAHVESE